MQGKMVNITDFSALDKVGNGGIANSHLKDDKHIIVKCSNCSKSLCDIWVTQPALDVHSEIVASCDYCGNKSYKVNVDGKFHLGHTDESNITNAQNTFEESPPGKTGVFQKVQVQTKRIA